jgi:pyruvate dehydrogenase (quinone)
MKRCGRDRTRSALSSAARGSSLAACGYAKFTGRIGCRIATSGPGGIRLLYGLYDAKLDGVPVPAITGW